MKQREIRDIKVGIIGGIIGFLIIVLPALVMLNRILVYFAKHPMENW